MQASKVLKAVAGSSGSRVVPAHWLALSLVCLAIDYSAGPVIEFPVVYLIPISVASWFGGRRWGMTLAFVLPLCRLYFRTVWNPPWTFYESSINAAIRIGVFASFAWLIDRTARQMLGVCSVCKNIRDERLDAWQSLDSYIQAHPGEFRQELCPACARHVRDVVDRR
jgi:hypothetical protein